jgi:predicted Zn-dependent protease with MMP-like domain
MLEIEPEEFERLVEKAVRALPESFRDQLNNVDFTVEAWANAADYARMRLPRGSTLLGVYRGVPLTKRGRGYSMVLPDRIVIFRGPLLRLANDERDLAERVTRVVRHEVAHYFGISDERLHELDAY